MNKRANADINNASFLYSLNMLNILLRMKLITEEEYNRIAAISKKHYDVKINCA
ncbi:MAG: hypothetical protein IKZ82_04275 [Clostridia bacterium]|nr:hypothetical protein [Clostridia bacterium]